MDYFTSRSGGAEVQAIGYAASKGDDTAYYARFAGPSEASQSVWAAAVASTRQSYIKSSYFYRAQKMARPVARASIKLPNSNYVDTILRSKNPGLIIVTRIEAAMLTEMGLTRAVDARFTTEESGLVGQFAQTRYKAYEFVRRILPDWPLDERLAEQRDGTLTLSTILTAIAKQQDVEDEFQRKLVNAINAISKAPVLPEWGPYIAANLPSGSYVQLSCWGEVVRAVILNPEYQWSSWFSLALRSGKLAIPTPEEHHE